MMLHFSLSDTSAELIVTLTEYVTINDPYFLFVFKHVLTNDEVKFIKSEAADESNYPERFNQFTINPSVVFPDKHPGEWHYKVYEQASSTNINPASAGNLLEQGKLMTVRPVEFEFTKYDQPTTYKTYNG